MRRIVMALIGTVAGVTLLVGLKSPAAPGAQPLSAAAPPDPSTPAGAGASPGPAGPTGTPGSTAGPNGAPTTGPANPPGPTSTAPGPATTPPRTTAPTGSRTITGTAFAARTAKSPNCGECSGNMQVRIVVTGKHIDSIQTIQVSNRPKSVASTLTQQALTAQSANVGTVSGATYSALAWKQSLQSAINQI
jgi:uncharacterized protein with FMN-binding domain